MEKNEEVSACLWRRPPGRIACWTTWFALWRVGSVPKGVVERLHFSRPNKTACKDDGALVSPISSAAFIGDARSQANICLTLDVIALGVEFAEAYGVQVAHRACSLSDRRCLRMHVCGSLIRWLGRTLKGVYNHMCIFGQECSPEICSGAKAGYHCRENARQRDLETITGIVSRRTGSGWLGC
jgi:hypothetical protein